MNDLSFNWSGLQEWLLRASWQAAVLAGLVLLAQRLLGARLTPAWRYRLWLLVVVRLVLPYQAPSVGSVHNLARLSLRGSEVSPAVSMPLMVPSAEPGLENLGATGVRVAVGEAFVMVPPTERARETEKADTGNDTRSEALPGFIEEREAAGWSWSVVAGWIWVAGVALLVLRITMQNLVFRARLQREATPAGPALLGMLENCRRVLGVKVQMVVLETNQVQSPAIYGFLRPTLLLPRGLATEFSEQELRYVLLHELAHVKRWDAVMTWVLALLQVLHWFNPVLWLAFARMRADRELACDALVLNRSRDGEAVGYGETILRLVEVMSRGKAMPGLVGILEDKAQIAERIRMIARFRRPGRASAFAALLLVLLGWVGLTDAAPGSKPLPPVMPLRLTNLLVSAENKAWLEESVWKAPPRGSNVFGGIEFHLEGLIQLSGTGPEGDGKRYRDRVIVPLQETNGVGSKARVIQRGTNVGALHLVGGTAYDATAETKIAEVIWRYTDGTFKRTPILYGVHLRDWWRARYEQPARLPGPHAKVIWRGTHADATRWGGKTLRLYRLSLANPEPKRVIRQLELVSARARPATLILAMTLDPLAPGERPDATADLEEVDPELTGHLQVTVQDMEFKPLVGAEIRVQAREKGQTGNGVESPRAFTTDGQGVVDVLRPAEGVERLQITVSKPEYGTRRVVWNVTNGDTIPASVTVNLNGAIRIGGTVVDPDGNPVSGAKVTLSRFWRGGESQGARGDGVDFERQEHTTGADGRWSTGQVPPEILHRIGISAEHPDYILARAMGDWEKQAIEKLKQGAYELRLGRGLEVRGRVLDTEDKPISGATVWAGGRDTVERKETQSAGDGTFVFRNVVEGRVSFSVLAKGKEPATQTVKVSADTPEVVFRLGAGNVIRARVQNADGEPLAGARVVLEGSGEIGRSYEFSTRTDDDGRFEWDSAPSEPMPFYFYAAGYEQKRNHVLRPSEDNTVVLKRERRVLGKVVDASSGEPVTRFKVAVGHAWDKQLSSFYADYPGATEFISPEGSFELKLNEEQTNALQTEAEEYAGVTELLPEERDGEVNVTVKLKRTSALRGVVVDASGQPVPGTQITVAPAVNLPRGYGPSAVNLKEGRLEIRGLGRGVVVESVEGGKFVVPSTPEEGTVIAAGPAGFAAMALSEVRASGRILLLPYGAIEGTYRVLGQPVPNEEFLLNLTSMGIQADFQTYRAKTDSAGRFKLEGVPAGAVGVIRLIQTNPNSWEHGLETSVTVLPGQTAQIQMGGSGLVVRGQARFETPPTDEDVSIAGHLVTQGPPIPANFASTEEATAFFESPAWKEHMATQKRYAVRVRPDGSLQFDSVVPGRYDLTVSATVPGEQPWRARPIAEGRTQVVIPAESDPQAPVQIGEVILKALPKPQGGTP